MPEEARERQNGRDLLLVPLPVGIPTELQEQPGVVCTGFGKEGRSAADAVVAPAGELQGPKGRVQLGEALGLPPGDDAASQGGEHG